MTRFTIVETRIAGVRIVERLRLADARGSFARLFCRDEFAAFGGPTVLSQINHSVTRAAGTVRGMHLQRAPWSETKLVSCLRGEIFDVAVDLRPDSPTRFQWVGVELAEDGDRSLLIPQGCAHGFQTLTDDCGLVYLHDQPHTPAAETGVNPLDPRLAIAWPRPVAALSDRDRALPFLTAP
ncbi:dTDP-4-keto-6-deoxy-D-glucose epimerase [Siculibacillus lacustris]|uniref:dTDP-4-dehydrorhamnose 3,5-epimerase n=1 Tax=Siculibacillus lacustris TaxID=1549641 RepID=A0A4V2KTP4_9HYPH|nr:dTDP-4-dehydrorhamnose 3,5-epimerase family protein [Siculibacillus lacustris]TBW38268.1 dTDP-4-keto-6-deoxy-D-glucose epimerase [Siculibacillus lacustris]